jgi:hypothetical protein
MTNAVKVVTSKNKKNEKFFTKKHDLKKFLLGDSPKDFREKRRLPTSGGSNDAKLEETFLIYFCVRELVRETFFGRKSFYMYPVRNGRQSEKIFKKN